MAISRTRAPLLGIARFRQVKMMLMPRLIECSIWHRRGRHHINLTRGISTYIAFSRHLTSICHCIAPLCSIAFSTHHSHRPMSPSKSATQGPQPLEYQHDTLGELRGLLRDDILQFRGVPYASIPARFRQSVVVEKLPHTPFDASEPGYVITCSASHHCSRNPVADEI
jgi:hypothetical protein